MCGFKEASELARGMLLHKQVEVAQDPTQDELDAYGRALLYIAAPEWDYSTAVTRADWAKRHVFQNNPVQKDPAILAAEKAAQADKAGLWGALCAPPAPAPAAAPGAARNASRTG